jgi:hypothetical protein
MSEQEGLMEDRRGAVRVPVRGVAVLHGGAGPIHATIENLSRTGALVSASGAPYGELDVELRVGGHAWVSGRAVRTIDTRHSRSGGTGKRTRVALAFDRSDDRSRAVIDAAIQAAITAAVRRPVLVIDDRDDRRRDLAARLADRGMTPLAPRTPLEAIDLLARSQLHVAVCLVAPFNDNAASELHDMLADSFPWVHAAPISDDLDDTVVRAAVAWSQTDVAHLATALA